MAAKNRDIDNALNSGFTEPVRDALWGHVYMTPQLKAITRSKPFIRMHRIAQLGPASIVYPGATHTRAAHSIGVYHITRRILCNLCDRLDWTTFNGIRSMLCAALLHDVGHFPFAHSLKELPLKSHEQLSADIINSCEMKDLIEAAGGNQSMAAAIVDPSKSVTGTDAEITFYRRLLSGVLDPDKLDYLNRDARYCGVPYGIQDLDFLLSMIHPHKDRGIDIDKRGITSVESVLFSKYLMYRSVYWHPSVRSADAMIKKALFAALNYSIQGSKYQFSRLDNANCQSNSSIIRANQLYQLDDQELFALMREKSGELPVLRLGEDVRQGKLYVCVCEFSYNEAEHSHLSNIEGRTEFEQHLTSKINASLSAEFHDGKKISADQIIVDLPDPINYESSLFVRDTEKAEENYYFGQSKKTAFGAHSGCLSCFNDETVASFAKALRIVRVFVDQDIKDQAAKFFASFDKWNTPNGTF